MSFDRFCREEIVDHRVCWNSRFEFECKLTATLSTGILDACTCRVSVRRVCIIHLVVTSSCDIVKINRDLWTDCEIIGVFSGVAGWEKLPEVRICGHKSSRIRWRNSTKSIVPFRRIQFISTS